MSKAAGKNQISVSNNSGDLFIDVDWLFFSVRALAARQAKCPFVVLKWKRKCYMSFLTMKLWRLYPKHSLELLKIAFLSIWPQLNLILCSIMLEYLKLLRKMSENDNDGPKNAIVTINMYCSMPSVKYLLIFSKVNVWINLVIFADEHLLDWNNLTLLGYPDIIFFLKISESQKWPSGFWGMFVLRSFTFTVPQRRNYLLKPPQPHRCFEERLFVHLSVIVLHHIICLDNLDIVLLRHILGDIEWWLIFL